MAAHRASYIDHHGPIPAGKVIHHKCSVRNCVNPDHLEAVTQAENIRLGLGTKLSYADIEDLVRMRLIDNEGLKEIAERFGVSTGLVSAYCRGAEAGLKVLGGNASLD